MAMFQCVLSHWMARLQSIPGHHSMILAAVTFVEVVSSV